MIFKRLLAIAFLVAVIGTATLFAVQAANPHQASAPPPTRPALNPAMLGDPHSPDPCEMDLGVNYVDGKLHGTPSPGQIGVNYIDGKVHKNDIPLFTPDDRALCIR